MRLQAKPVFKQITYSVFYGTLAGFAWFHVTSLLRDRTAQLPSFFEMALWALVLPITSLATACAYYLMMSKTDEDCELRCRQCGYILRGLSEPRCPECGERI